MRNILRISHRRWWIAGVACAAAAIVFGGWIYAPRQDLNEKKELAAQDEVYAAVVRDMITPADARLRVTQLVFGDEILSDRRAGTDAQACKEEVRKREHWDFDALPYDTLLDKTYRFLTRGWISGSAATETVENFLLKSCSTGHLSRSFHTDLPRSFVGSENVHFEGWPIDRAPSFEKLFPGASGIISLSYVGFNSATDEAMVSVHFVCGGLCGEGWHYILKKRRGKWEVAGKRMNWVS